MPNFAQKYSLYSPAQHCVGHTIHFQSGLFKFRKALKHIFCLTPVSIHLYSEKDKPIWRIQESARYLLVSPSAFSNLEVAIQYIQMQELKNNESNPSKILRLVEESPEFRSPICCLCITTLLCKLSWRITDAVKHLPTYCWQASSCVGKSSWSISEQFKDIFCYNS